MHSLNFCATSPGSACLAKSTNANTTTIPLWPIFHSILSNSFIHFKSNSHPFHPISQIKSQINQKMPKTQFILFILPLLIVSIVEAAPRGKANSAPISAENTGGYNGFQEKESVRDVNGAEGTEFVTEADQEVEQEEMATEGAQKEENDDAEQLNENGQKKKKKMVVEEEEEDYGHIHPRPHEAVDGKMPGVQHYTPVKETGYFRGDELPENAGHEEGQEEDQLNEKEDDEKEQKEDEEEGEGERVKDEEEDKESKIGQSAHAKKALGEENKGEDEASKQSGGTQADQPNMEENGGNETEMNGGEGEKEGEKEEDEEEEKFLHIYPFLKSATPKAVTDFRALLRDQHLTKLEVEEKRKEWANDQPEEVKKGFFDWKDRLEAKRQKKMKSIEKKLESKVKDGKNKLDDKTQQLYLEIKAVIVNQAISRHEECKQIRSLVNSEDEELREYFLEQVKLRLIKFCLDEEEQQIVEDSMPPGPGPEEGKQKDDGLPTSDGTDDLEQNHPSPAQLQPQKQQQLMVNEGNGGEFAQQQQSEPFTGGDQFDSQNSKFNGEMNEKLPAKMEIEHGKVGEKEGMEGKAEIGETEGSEENFDNDDAGKLEDDFEDKFPKNGKAPKIEMEHGKVGEKEGMEENTEAGIDFENTEKMDKNSEDKFQKKEEAKEKA